MTAGIPKSLWWGLGIGIVAFFVSVSTLSTSSGAGGSTCSYTDYAAIVLGVIAAIMGIGGAVKAKGHAPAMGLGALVAVLGVVHVCRGLGLVMSPCG